MPRTLLFVYGTLKRGLANHHLLAGQQFVGQAVTLPRYKMYDTGSNPCLVKAPQGGVAVHGELWSVDEETIAQLDEFEETPYGFVRERIEIAGVVDPVQAYFFAGDTSRLALVGDRWPALAESG
jgi:gamma-glutamylcyclotransferase (GGCT)/AIG2-like uncharacterized protein YtfP